MGLLDSLLSMASAAPKATKTNQNAVTSIMDVLMNNQQGGGLDNIVDKLTKAGLWECRRIMDQHREKQIC